MRTKSGLARDGSKIIAVRLSEPWESRRYITQKEMKLKISDFPEDTIFISEGQESKIRKIYRKIEKIKNALIDNARFAKI